MPWSRLVEREKLGISRIYGKITAHAAMLMMKGLIFILRRLKLKLGKESNLIWMDESDGWMTGGKDGQVVAKALLLA